MQRPGLELLAGAPVALDGPGLRLAGAWIASPAELSSLVRWYRATAGVTTATDGAAVSAWSDQSGVAAHLAQGTAGNQPVFRAVSQSGLPGVDFDGSNDSLAASAFGLVRNAAGGTLFAVVRPESTAAGVRGIVTLHTPTSGNPRAWLMQTGAQWRLEARRLDADATAAGDGGTADLNAHVLVAVFDYAAGTARLHVDSAHASPVVTISPSAGSTSDTQGNTLRVGSTLSTSGTFNGVVYEAGVYNRALTAAEVAALFSHLRNFWGI